MNPLENKEILSENIINAIDIIIENYPQAVFGGSIALNAVGLLNRKISDIDIFVSNKNSLSFIGLLNIKYDKESITSHTITDTNGNLIQRTGININGVRCCIFKVSDEELQSTKFKFCDRIIKIQNVNYAIQAKISYAVNHAKDNKHENDLLNINKIFDEYF